MTPGHPTADLIFEQLSGRVAIAFATVQDLPTADLRHALAALSVFRGPGTVARDVAMQIIRNELAEREGAQ